jgi:hypothetical protein
LKKEKKKRKEKEEEEDNLQVSTLLEQPWLLAF